MGKTHPAIKAMLTSRGLYVTRLLIDIYAQICIGSVYPHRVSSLEY